MFRKNYINSIQLEIDGSLLSKPCEVAEVFAKHFGIVYNNSHLGNFPSLLQTSECFSLPPISNSDVCKALKCLQPSKSVGLDDIPVFVINGCSEIFMPVLKFIFNPSLSQQQFSTLWEQAAFVPVFKKKGSSASVKILDLY
jgi:hypothetical protein